MKSTIIETPRLYPYLAIVRSNRFSDFPQVRYKSLKQAVRSNRFSDFPTSHI
ncbi:MAG: hypothetical protein SXA11_06965 [Cyanobacteriota bacterium]|nr:hypothetical protein [Cyanobacteriota bacterium]